MGAAERRRRQIKNDQFSKLAILLTVFESVRIHVQKVIEIDEVDLLGSII